VIPHRGQEGSVVKLVLAVLIRVSERWGKKCFSDCEQRPLRTPFRWWGESVTSLVYDTTLDSSLSRFLELARPAAHGRQEPCSY
jgi:hypothetical protein